MEDRDYLSSIVHPQSSMVLMRVATTMLAVAED
jgi:hypothetical protein